MTVEALGNSARARGALVPVSALRLPRQPPPRPDAHGLVTPALRETPAQGPARRHVLSSTLVAAQIVGLAAPSEVYMPASRAAERYRAARALALPRKPDAQAQA
jgi:hypothetical protein